MHTTIPMIMALVKFCLVESEFVNSKHEIEDLVNNPGLRSELSEFSLGGNFDYAPKSVPVKRGNSNQNKTRSSEIKDDTFLSKYKTFNIDLKNEVGKKSTLDLLKYEETTLGLDTITDWHVYNKGREYAFEITKPESSPYSVLLFNFKKNGQRFGPPCAGSLLTPEWVLTAAFCFNSSVSTAHSVTVYAGGNSESEFVEEHYANGSQILNSSMILTHPDYRRDDYDVSFNDIAVVKTKGKFTMSRTVNVIGLSPEPWTFTKFTECKITGFGKVLKYASNPEDYVRKTYYVQVKSPCMCYEKTQDELGLKELDRWICAWPRKNFGVCEGDFGAGLICGGELKAVTSIFVSVKDRDSCELKKAVLWDCGNKNSFSVYQNTCPYMKWINQHVQLMKDEEIAEKCSCDVNRFSFLLLVFCLFLLLSRTMET